MPEFDTPRPITLAVDLPAGSVEVFAEPRETANVEVDPYDDREASREAAANARVQVTGDRLTIAAPEQAGWLWRRGGRLRVRAHVPQDSALQLTLASADANCRGRLRSAQVRTASGDVTVEEVADDATAKSASGDLLFERVGGELRADSASGDIVIGRVGGAATVGSASGRVEIGDAGGSVAIRTASGDVDLRCAHRGEVRVQSASGDVTVGVAAGTGVWLDLGTMSGTTHSELAVNETGTPPAPADLMVTVRTMSGDVEVVRASQKTVA
jgi:hypothetical protein